MLTFPHPDPEALCQRLRQRGTVISHTEPHQMQHYLERATELGQLLRCARQYLERSCPAVPIDPTTQWLWEQGLALPEELLSNQMQTLVWSYARAILREGQADPELSFSLAGKLRTAVIAE